MMTEKEILRKKIKNRIAMLTKNDCKINSKSIADKLLGLSEYKEANTIFVYNSFGCEVITDEILLDAIKSGKRVSVPRIIGDDEMEAVIIDAHTDYITNEWGINEPVTNDLLSPECIELSIIPLVGFDRQGNRLGRGKGFYDKFLQGLSCKKIALAYSIQEEKQIAIDQYDIKIDKIITEKEIIG